MKISRNTENLLSDCFLLLSTISRKKFQKDELETYQHICSFSDKICPLHYHKRAELKQS